MTERESSRSRPEGAYDVFLSFKGEDTRKMFTEYLYAILDQAGIHTFRDDDELPRGAEIPDHLLRAIQESKISIVVFSKGYASSIWCLNELVEILKCKKKTGQIVIRIFYDIGPLDVRKQTGSFAEAFDKHEERFEKKLVKEWRKALEEAGNLSGWNLEDMANGSEAKFIEEIIKDVLNNLEHKYLYVPEHLDGANINCDDRGKFLIKERLCRKRVLVVADDVALQDQLNALMGDRSWFGPGSRVIITTRDSSVLLKADQTYQIKEVEPDEALQLFSWHAFKDTKPAEEYIELSKKAVDYCGGLPLALTVIGARLSGKNRGRWESEIDYLSINPNQDIQGKLLTSFDALDIACFSIDRKKEYVAKVLGARCRCNPEVVLETLRERSLIKVLGETVTMHDLLRDMGREVVRESFPLLLGKRTKVRARGCMECT
ncbi:disease resistance protein Roq1-like isoform X2 [Populus alba]|uniref:disease resistance protein Roq1-like isoform X2 n=1 Tax=Populus alba TaxID=43335 RepID=UPI003CC777CC